MWIISKIRNDNSSKMLLANFTYLSIIEIIGLLLPLITFPYLIRTIGAQKYGIIVFAQTIVAYLVILDLMYRQHGELVKIGTILTK